MPTAPKAETTEFYMVERGLTKFIKQTVEYVVPTEDFGKHLAVPRDNNLLFLPAQTRAVFAQGATGRVAYMIEQAPSVRTVTFPPGVRRKEKKDKFTLAIPWVYMIFTANRRVPDDINSELTFEGMSIYVARKRVMTLTDTLTGLPMNNVEQNGRICFGTAAAPMGANLGEHIDTLTNNFWNSNFNYDHTPVLPGYADYLEWEKDTEKSPTCWLEWDWDKTKGLWGHPEFPLSELVGITADRLTPAQAVDPIPDLPQAPTFGRAAAWVATLDERQRGIIKAALEKA